MKTFNYLLLLTGFATATLVGRATYAQESQINVKITREINGEKKTYEGHYENEEQMQSDKNLQEFMEENAGNGFSFGTPPSQPGTFHSYFDFDDEDSTNSFSHHFKMMFPDDSLMTAFKGMGEEFHNHLDPISEEMKEKLEELRKELEKNGFGDNTFHFNWMWDDEEIDPGSRHSNSSSIIIHKKIEVSEEVGNDFGKKGLVKPQSLLVLPDLKYYPNPSANGRFKLRFNAPTQGELSIKVFNLEGREVFSRYFERFGGLYAETIDLTRQEKGIYLLEIGLADKRLTRKIIIDEQ